MAYRVTFVCEANVCRSPLMAFSFAHGDGTALGGEWTVTSRGTNVGGTRLGICPVAASLIESVDGAKAFISAHRSAPLNGNQLAAQDLIIVASSAERSAIAKVNPDLRSRTFTLREATMLGREPVTFAEQAQAASRRNGTHGRVRLAGYPDVLHGRRGLVATPSPAAHMPWRRATPNPVDIPDAHHQSSKRHLATLKALQDDVGVLRAQIAAFLADHAE